MGERKKLTTEDLPLNYGQVSSMHYEKLEEKK
jgi:hypothetical protein